MNHATSEPSAHSAVLPQPNSSPVIETVDVADLGPGITPRRDGVDNTHARMLAESETTLPPILVHRGTMRIVDGMHRLAAARIRGDDTIDVRYVEGDDITLFAEAVRENISHGLPLSRTDREEAAVRLLTTGPEWSDRAVASVTGLSRSTVAKIRSRSTGPDGQSNTRLGRDGRSRPVVNVEGRLAASRLMEREPTLSLREVAQAVGVSVSTARDVRQRIRRGDHPLPARLREASPAGRGGEVCHGDGPDSHVSVHAVWTALRRDPAMRGSAACQSLLHQMRVLHDGDAHLRQVVTTVPPHCRRAVAVLARRCAAWWTSLSDALEQRRAAS